MSANQQPDLTVLDLARVATKSVSGGAFRRSAPKHRHLSFVAPPAQEYEIADGDFFLHALALERKRSERSGKPFLLVLLRGREVFHGDSGKRVVRQLQQEVFSTIRDIDLAGWYEEDAALGIIFTELDGADDGVAAAILARVTEALTRSLDKRQADGIEITCHAFPSDSVDGSSDVDERMRFYPDVPRRERRRRFASAVKRTIDIVGSLSALLILAPVFLMIAVWIKLTSKGPVFFRQQRVGQYGNMFTFLKFRSMYVNNDSKIHQEFVTRLIDGKHDPGPKQRFLRLRTIRE